MDSPLKKGRKESPMKDEAAKLLLAQRSISEHFCHLTQSGYLTDLICLLFRNGSGLVSRKGRTMRTKDIRSLQYCHPD